MGEVEEEDNRERIGLETNYAGSLALRVETLHTVPGRKCNVAEEGAEKCNDRT